MTAIQDRVKSDLIAAMKSGDAFRKDTLRLIKSELDKAETDKGSELTDAEAVTVVNRAVKQRHDAADAFLQAGRSDLSDKEKNEAAILTEYLPEQLSEDKLRELVDEAVRESGAASKSDMGKVMKAIMPKVSGRADGKLVKSLVDEAIAKLTS
ncbi:MAG: GatB/YqeY domain-containing protein [Deltaproteobacteria bacterium]|nr:GatB/YqeY domain-containing protein [bacterium]MCB9477999.1 GatB/YqeY domain-containing protein [Deltaproteobacteria bacterium]MCB9478600.1 GatB/YqeY domain-containing protein [Deltaproteobacteria bacterium]MCB9488316.1 GatB/YqeY domain-containing protein [Deltaproteobacteria bacterium]